MIRVAFEGIRHGWDATLARSRGLGAQGFSAEMKGSGPLAQDAHAVRFELQWGLSRREAHGKETTAVINRRET